MATRFKPISQARTPFRIISFNGGGIYGLYTAIMFRKLCENNKAFLKNDQVQLFTGTSAGALISLFLAMQDNPREAALSGQLEEMFKSSLLYSNVLDPVQEVTSLMGLTAWSGREDTMALYDAAYGNLKMGDLKHRVIIATFDWYGRRKGHWGPVMFDNFSKENNHPDLLVKNLAYYASSPATLRPIVDGYSDAGIFADNPGVNAVGMVIKQMSLDTQLPDSLKKILEILADSLTKAQSRVLSGEISFQKFKEICVGVHGRIQRRLVSLEAGPSDHPFGPSLLELEKDYPGGKISRKDLIALIKKQGREEFGFLEAAFIEVIPMNDEFKQRMRLKINSFAALFDSTLEKSGASKSEGQASQSNLFADTKRFFLDLCNGSWRLLGDIQLLSMGIGAFIPNYFTPDFNLGILPFWMIPTNICQNAFLGPQYNMFFEPITEDTVGELGNLLGEQHFQTLNAPIIGWPVPPVFLCGYTSRFNVLRERYIEVIEKRSKNHEATEALEEAIKWLEDRNWD